MRRAMAWAALVIAMVMTSASAAWGAEAKNHVYVLHVDQFRVIDPSVAQMTRRAFEQAHSDPSAVAVAIVIDTPGGYLDSALAMKNLIMGSPLKTVALVSTRAWSAGALIATSSQYLYMAPGSSIGAAEPREAGTNQPADYKTVSALNAEFRSTARDRGRDADVAKAMVDKSAKIPGQKDELLVLTAQEATELKFANGQAKSLDEALAQAGVTDYTLVDVKSTLSDEVGRFLTTPFVATLLLVVGVIAIGIEFMKPGVAVPGLIGVVCLGLFFVGYVLVGTAGWLELGLAFLGMVLVVIEAFIPGFGVFGVAGLISMVVSIFMAVPDERLAIRYLMWASVAFVIALIGIIRGISQRGLGKALTLEASASGWVPARADLSALIGAQGTTLTVLRPAGTALVGDMRIDVVSESEFLSAGTSVKVIRVDGTRVIVRSFAQ